MALYHFDKTVPNVVMIGIGDLYKLRKLRIFKALFVFFHNFNIFNILLVWLFKHLYGIFIFCIFFTTALLKSIAVTFLLHNQQGSLN